MDILPDIIIAMARQGQEYRHEGQYEIVRFDYTPSRYSYADTGGYIPLDSGGSIYQVIKTTYPLIKTTEPKSPFREYDVFFVEIDGGYRVNELNEEIFWKLSRANVQPFFLPDCSQQYPNFHGNIHKIKELEWGLSSAINYNVVDYYKHETGVTGIQIAFHKPLIREKYEDYAIKALEAMRECGFKPNLDKDTNFIPLVEFSSVWTTKWEAIITPGMVISWLDRLPKYIPFDITLKKIPRAVINNRVHVFGDIAQFEEDMTKAVLMGS